MNLTAIQIRKITGVETDLLDSIEEEGSSIRIFFTLLVIRVVLQNSSDSDKELFKHLLTKGESGALDWLESNSARYTSQIKAEVEHFLHDIRLTTLFGDTDG